MSINMKYYFNILSLSILSAFIPPTIQSSFNMLRLSFILLYIPVPITTNTLLLTMFLFIIFTTLKQSS